MNVWICEQKDKCVNMWRNDESGDHNVTSKKRPSTLGLKLYVLQAAQKTKRENTIQDGI